MIDKMREFSKNADKYLSIDEIGDVYLDIFVRDYVAKRFVNVLPIFLKAYDLMVERGNFSSRKSFGGMCRDRRMWVEKHDNIKVIVLECQSYKTIYILNGSDFNVRALYHENTYHKHRKLELKNITISKFRKIGFDFHNSHKIEDFGAFKYGDARDEAYILSIMYHPLIITRCDHVNEHSLQAIKDIEQWEYYLNNIDELL